MQNIFRDLHSRWIFLCVSNC